MADPGKHTLGKWTLERGYMSAVARGRGGNFMVRGSMNGMITGDGLVRANRGPWSLPLTGSRVSFSTDDSYAGLGTHAVNGNGSVFKVRQLLHYIGSGQVNYAGAPLAGIIATKVLSFIRKIAGVYDTTIEYQAGHAQPPAPTIFPKVPSPGKIAMNAAISVVIWRICDISGGVSLMSLPSNVLSLAGESVIVQIAALPDLNGQSHWGVGVPKIALADLGNYYELPTSIGGEVAESALSYTRVATGGSIANGTNVVNISDPDVADRFTAADVGRRIAFGGFDSWITEIVSPTQCKTFDVNASGGDIAGNATITHAVNGITRAVEISWSNGMLQGQALAPDKAFPPVPADFAGVNNDVLYLDADGIIYVSEPGQNGSFAPRNALFASSPAVLWLPGEDGLKIRFSRNNIGALYYVGGRPALEYYEFRKHQGIKYPQNAGVGFNGRICAWLGRPTILTDSLDVDAEYSSRVLPDFLLWDEGQSAERPIVFGYDGQGQYECWCFGKRIMAKYGPTGAWCAPNDDIDNDLPGDIVDAVTVDNSLYLICFDGESLRTYKYDAGSGTTMIIQTDDMPSRGSFDTITEVRVKGRADRVDRPVVVDVVVNFDDASPEIDPLQGLPEQTPDRIGNQYFATRRPDITDAQCHGVRVTMKSLGNIGGIDFGHECGVDIIETAGATSDIVV